MDIIDINTVFGAWPSQHAPSTPESLVEQMTANKVSRAFALSTWGLYYQDMAGNEETLRCCKASNKRLIPVATINPSGFWSGTEDPQEISQKGFPLYRFCPHLQGWPMDYAPFAQVIRVLSESGKPLLERAITVPKPSRGYRLLIDGGKPIMVSIRNPGDATQLARLVVDYPGPVILEGVSGLTVAEALTVMQMHEHLMIETHALHIPDGIARLVETIGPDRVFFGSGAPGLSLGAALGYVRGATISEHDKAAVLGGNANNLVLGGS